MGCLVHRCGSDGPGSTPESMSQPGVPRRRLLRGYPGGVAIPFPSVSPCWTLLAASSETPAVAECSSLPAAPAAFHHCCGRGVAVPVPAAEPPEHSWGTCDADPG